MIHIAYVLSDEQVDNLNFDNAPQSIELIKQVFDMIACFSESQEQLTANLTKLRNAFLKAGKQEYFNNFLTVVSKCYESQMDGLEFRFEYSNQDFTEGQSVYEEVYVIENDFLRLQKINQLAEEAKKCGIKNFPSLYKAYEKSRNEKEKAYVGITSGLECDENGKRLATIENFLRIIRGEPKFSGIKFNLLTCSPEIETPDGVEPWQDKHDAWARYVIEHQYGIHNIQKYEDAMRIIFAENEYHPVRQLVDSLEWDGESRVENFLNFVARCEDSDYVREVSRLIFAGGINRAYKPGCKFDDMPVLIGKQGEGKSTLVRWLAMKDDFFTEIVEFDGQKGAEALDGAWICEVGELLALTKTKEQEAVKAFLTRQNDRRRMPYDKRTSDHPRQCIFIGTTNKEQFLIDKTGNRRFYPVKVTQSGYEMFRRKAEIQEYIRQCWAEARAKIDTEFMQPYARYDIISTIRAKQEEAVEDDYRAGMIIEYLREKDEICILEIWQNALNNGEFSKPTRKESNEIALILNSIDGWARSSKPKRLAVYGFQKYWYRVQSDFEEILL